ncbi:hypothetical protein [Amycolatopsis panacis]|uniref:hypothetical protein n=1 Tax=Amycolatopsis panacis TaxID=2340917 RepID=UPI0011C3F471|nr:hypothetical protein [Amycolatopsis panacis]
MSGRQGDHGAPIGASRRRRVSAAGVRAPKRIESEPVTATVSVDVTAAQAARLGLRKPAAPPDEETTAPEKPYSLPSFLGMFELPADASERVKDVVRGRADA